MNQKQLLVVTMQQIESIKDNWAVTISVDFLIDYKNTVPEISVEIFTHSIK